MVLFNEKKYLILLWFAMSDFEAKVQPCDEHIAFQSDFVDTWRWQSDCYTYKSHDWWWTEWRVGEGGWLGAASPFWIRIRKTNCCYCCFAASICQVEARLCSLTTWNGIPSLSTWISSWCKRPCRRWACRSSYQPWHASMTSLGNKLLKESIYSQKYLPKA